MARTPTQADDDRTVIEETPIMADIYESAANALDRVGYDATGSASYNRTRQHDRMSNTARCAFKNRDDAKACEFVNEYMATFDKLTWRHESASGNYARKASVDVLRSLAAGLRGVAARGDSESIEEVPGEEHREAIHALARDGLDAMAVILCDEYEGVADDSPQAIECPDCNGDGSVPRTHGYDAYRGTVACDLCDGDGMITRRTAERIDRIMTDGGAAGEQVAPDASDEDDEAADSPDARLDFNYRNDAGTVRVHRVWIKTGSKVRETTVESYYNYSKGVWVVSHRFTWSHELCDDGETLAGDGSNWRGTGKEWRVWAEQRHEERIKSRFPHDDCNR
jgi:hypothetical protein